ncbi:glycosyltransferase family 4 protein [Peribacillus sp. B-H-3]|uniref:glycosyltransferase family 4 protein n=1 Tax=Peribacillus sp. B-H-3 TaxID=3400420 RepID=UPI003B02E8D1
MYINYLKVFTLKKVEEGYVIVAPSATLTGAPLLSLEIAKSLNKTHDNIIIITMSGGQLKSVMKRESKVINISGTGMNNVSDKLISNLVKKGYKKYMCNSVVSAIICESIKKNGGETITLIHEMKDVIQKLNFGNKIDMIIQNSKKIIFSAKLVNRDFESMSSVPYEYINLKQGLYNKSIIENYSNKNVINLNLRYKLKFKINDFIVMGSGSDWKRKGFDYFVEIANKIDNKRIKFLWIGTVRDFPQSIPANITLIDKVSSSQIYKYFYMSNLFFLSSIEDPFPSVVLEAMASGIPVIAFKDTGGAQEIISKENGFVMDINKRDEILNFLNLMLNDKELYEKISYNNRTKIIRNFHFDNYVKSIVKLFD